MGNLSYWTLTIFYHYTTAQSIVQNSGFEVDLYPVANNSFHYAHPPSAWTVYDPTNVMGSLTYMGVVNSKEGSAINDPTFHDGAPEGNQCFYIDQFSSNKRNRGEVGIFQTLSGNIVNIGKTYTLTAWIGNSAPNTWSKDSDSASSYFDMTGFPGYKVQLLASDNILVEDDDTLSIAEAHWEQSKVTYNVLSGDANIGNTLKVRLINKNIDNGLSSGMEVLFDDVRLEITTITTLSPTNNPTEAPTSIPTPPPTYAPTSIPTPPPTYVPTSIPTPHPTYTPTSIPTSITLFPSVFPSIHQTPFEPTNVRQHVVAINPSMNLQGHIKTQTSLQSQTENIERINNMTTDDNMASILAIVLVVLCIVLLIASISASIALWKYRNNQINAEMMDLQQPNLNQTADTTNGDDAIEQRRTTEGDDGEVKLSKLLNDEVEDDHDGSDGDIEDLFDPNLKIKEETSSGYEGNNKTSTGNNELELCDSPGSINS